MEILPECRAMIDSIKENLDENKEFRKDLSRNLFLIVMTILLQVGSFLYLWGRINLQVEVNTGRLNYIEALFPRSIERVVGNGG